MSSINIGPGPTYPVTPNGGSVTVKHNGNLTVNPPSGGCTICFSQNVPLNNGQQQYTYTASGNQDIPFTGFAIGTQITYTVHAPTYNCGSDSGAKRSPVATAGQTITIGSDPVPK